MTDFELSAQSWVLRVGHHDLQIDPEGFVRAINSISYRKTVDCVEDSLLYGITEVRSELFGPVKCDTLDAAYVEPPDCTNSDCTMDDECLCCPAEAPYYDVCCDTHYSTLEDVCRNADYSKESAYTFSLVLLSPAVP